MASATSIDPQRYQQLANKLDIQDIMSSDQPRPEKKLPTINELQNKQYELKVKEFFLGKEEPSSSSGIILPPIDAYSQQTIRISIVSEKIMTWFVISSFF
jgi:hypothetical protein